MALSKHVQFDESLLNCAGEKDVAFWNRREKIEKQQIQKIITDLYYPWGNKPHPRGIRNLRAEDIIPSDELLDTKPCVSQLSWGRSGGGAPILTHSGRKWIHTKEHPIIRFQWNKDLRKCVDNTLRYKTNKEEQEQYRKELEIQVTERKHKEKWEKENDLLFHRRSFLRTPPWGKQGPGGTIWRPPRNIGINFLKSLGWSTENTLKAMANDLKSYRNNVLNEYDNFKRIAETEPAQHFNPTFYKNLRNEAEYDRYLNTRIEEAINKRRLSPLNKEVNSEELVTVIAQKRFDQKLPLSTTDVTRVNPEQRMVQHSKYLQELVQQMDIKKERLTKDRNCDVEKVRRHFDALDNFWGRPGHGAPKSSKRKGCLNRLLYNYTIPLR